MRLLEQVEWLRREGVDTFICDYATPLGMMALEELVRMRREGQEFRVYCFCSDVRRHTYRLLKKYEVDVLILGSQVDYSYRFSQLDAVCDLLDHSGLTITQRGVEATERLDDYDKWCGLLNAHST